MTQQIDRLKMIFKIGLIFMPKIMFTQYLRRYSHKIYQHNANYVELWKLLIDRNLNKTIFRELVGISTGTLAKLWE